MRTVTINLHGVKLLVSFETDGMQMYIDCIEIVDDHELTDLIMSLDEVNIETLAAEAYAEKYDVSRDINHNGNNETIER